MSQQAILNAVQFDANACAARVRVHALKPSFHEPVISDKKGTIMKTIQVYDKPMCCSSGVCGPQVDPVLPRFAADLQWLKSQGHQVERFNLAQQPEAFMENNEVHQLLATQGTSCLPLIVVDGRVVSWREYPSRDLLALWVAGEPSREASRSDERSSCCGGRCCS